MIRYSEAIISFGCETVKISLRVLKFALLLVLIELTCSHYVSIDKERELRPPLESYDKIHHHLLGNLEANMREAKRWFNEEVSKSSY